MKLLCLEPVPICEGEDEIWRIWLTLGRASGTFSRDDVMRIVKMLSPVGLKIAFDHPVEVRSDSPRNGYFAVSLNPENQQLDICLGERGGERSHLEEVVYRETVSVPIMIAKSYSAIFGSTINSPPPTPTSAPS